ncbi:hypothetical protein C3941_01845 [Kaistia algarum]|uniref:DUF2092 domain-containing protein n=1 Tax=Kaistia algarum TaxID=2083279 RepID=UPI000CE819EF|nr:DUF2092 domain-containing protein [Kaistia algarum]MCX5513037.1 DUF2092 domain-containing protein [Kaistia algarum]PPE81482.1 hypothetical protein C3941_01845 [Kaistia algarum]
MMGAVYANRVARVLRRAVGALVVPVLGLALAGPVHAADDASAIVKAMSDYVASQKTIAMTFDTSIEVVTPEIEKIRFASSGSLDLNRPNQFRAHRVGGYADVEAVSDGKLFTLLGRNLNRYAQLPIEGGTIDDIVAGLRQAGAELPAADLISSNAYDALMGGVIDGRHIGRGVIDGVECEHLAFRTLDTDWQLWVEIGEHPIPRQFVITSKAVAAAPEYTIRIKSWNTAPNFAADAFAFTAPKGAEKVDFAALGEMDEVPPSAAAKGDLK